MKKESFLICICCIPVSFFLIFSGKSLPVSSTMLIHSAEASDTAWKVSAIARLKDPAPGGGTYEEFDYHGYLESGALFFWARYGDNRRTDWALYNYKNGQTQLVLKALSAYHEPDGIPKEFFPVLLQNPVLALAATQGKFVYGRASSKLLYLVGRSGSSGPLDNIYAWDGMAMKKVIAKGDKITLPKKNREVVIKALALQWVTNDEQALIYFTAEDKTRGWLLHDGNNLKPFFTAGDEVPGLPGVKIVNVVTEGSFNDKIFFFDDTILLNMFVADAPYRQAIFRISKNKTEVIASHKGLNAPPVLLHAFGPGNFIFKTNKIYQFKNGNQKPLEENRTDLPQKNQFYGNDIREGVLVGPENETLLLSIGGDWPRIFSYDGNRFSLLVEGARASGKVIAMPYSFRTIRGVNGVFVNGLLLKQEGEWTQSEYLDGVSKEPRLVPAPELKTNGPDHFDLSDIVAVPDKNKLLVKKAPYYITGFFELTR